MGKDGEIKRLESYVERLLDGYSSLKAENTRLEHDLLGAQSNIEELQRRLESLESERGEVSSRVSSLIGRIEDWESECAGGRAEERGKTGRHDSVSGSKVDNVPSSEDPDDFEASSAGSNIERGGGVQGTLFGGNTRVA